jgi:ATP-dependent protease HslVU (ClpYQ) peptidase subunit
MTCIVAVVDGLYSDSKVSVEHLGMSYPAQKIVRGKDCLAGAAGNGGDCTRFLEWSKEGFKGKEPSWTSKNLHSEDYLLGLVVKDEGIYIFMPGDPMERIEAEFFAIGSGSKAARVAMLLGKTPEEAIQLAEQVDPGTGGAIQHLKLK